MEDTKQTLINILGDNFGIDESDIKDDSTVESLQLDSLDVVEFIIEVEDEFNIEISDEDAEKMAKWTFAEFKADIESRVSAK